MSQDGEKCRYLGCVDYTTLETLKLCTPSNKMSSVNHASTSIPQSFQISVNLWQSHLPIVCQNGVGKPTSLQGLHSDSNVLCFASYWPTRTFWKCEKVSQLIFGVLTRHTQSIPFLPNSASNATQMLSMTSKHHSTCPRQGRLQAQASNHDFFNWKQTHISPRAWLICIAPPKNLF